MGAIIDSFNSGGQALGCEEAIDVGLRAADALRLRLRADGQSFGVDELDLAHAEEAEEVAHVGGLRVLWRAGIQAAARREDIDLLAREKTDGSSLRVLEGHAGSRNVVEVRLERRREAEGVHRQAE